MPYQSVATSERLSISSTTSDPDPTASTSSSRENLLMSDGKPPPAGLFVTDLGSPYENPGRYESGYLDGTHNFKGLRRVADRIPVAAWFIIITEFCERFAYYGGSAPFQNYVQFPPGDHNQVRERLLYLRFLLLRCSIYFTQPYMLNPTSIRRVPLVKASRPPRPYRTSSLSSPF